MKNRDANIAVENAVKRVIYAGLVSTLASTASYGADLSLFAFDGTMNADEWRIVNDGVMGGRSQSSIRTHSDGSLIFKGHLSLKNNGGFASTRSPAIRAQLDSFVGVELILTGDGNSYKCGIRTTTKFDGVTYQATFKTVSGKEQVVRIPFKAFEPTWRGRRLDTESMNPGEIHNIGFLISDKQEGPFQLRVKSISAY
jgi:monofunctional biosynthetic peptidoglycan transglycosylase